jgi:hypothetical protein
MTDIATQSPCHPRVPFCHPRESGDPVNDAVKIDPLPWTKAGLLLWISRFDVSGYWVPAFARMTVGGSDAASFRCAHA